MVERQKFRILKIQNGRRICTETDAIQSIARERLDLSSVHIGVTHLLTIASSTVCGDSSAEDHSGSTWWKDGAARWYYCAELWGDWHPDTVDCLATQLRPRRRRATRHIQHRQAAVDQRREEPGCQPWWDHHQAGSRRRWRRLHLWGRQQHGKCLRRPRHHRPCLTWVLPGPFFAFIFVMRIVVWNR